MAMKPLVLAESYIAWHYAKAYRDAFAVWMNLLWFVFNFFSIFTLLSTFWEPWKRMDEGYPKGFDPGAWLSTLVVNMLMRIVGMVTRAVLILFGLVFAALIFFAGILFFALWTVMPALLIGIILLGVYLFLYG